MTIAAIFLWKKVITTKQEYEYRISELRREYADNVDRLAAACENDKASVRKDCEERIRVECAAMQDDYSRKIQAELAKIRLMAKSEKELLVNTLFAIQVLQQDLLDNKGS